MNQKNTEKKIWGDLTQMLGNQELSLGNHWNYNIIKDPKRLSFVLSRYKFAAKMLENNINILELGCSEGIGASILAENAKSYLGIDLDQDAIATAKNLFSDNKKFKFIYDDFLKKSFGKFQAIISLDVIEHIYPQNENSYFKTIIMNISPNGICIIGTPNITASKYASKASILGHVNLYSQTRLIDSMKKYFHQVFPFGMNDEILHTGFAPMSHYLLCIGCHKKDI